MLESLQFEAKSFTPFMKASRQPVLSVPSAYGLLKGDGNFCLLSFKQKERHATFKHRSSFLLSYDPLKYCSTWTFEFLAHRFAIGSRTIGATSKEFLAPYDQPRIRVADLNHKLMPAARVPSNVFRSLFAIPNEDAPLAIDVSSQASPVSLFDFLEQLQLHKASRVKDYTAIEMKGVSNWTPRKHS